MLGWVLWSHTRNGHSIWHLILFIIAALFAAYCAFWASSARSTYSAGSGSQPSPLLTIVSFIGAVLFAGYFALSAFHHWAFRCLHNSILYPISSVPTDWVSRFGSATVEQIQAKDSRLSFWIAILCLIIAVCFAVIAYAAFSSMSNYVQTAKILLILALTGAVLFGALALIKTVTLRPYYQLVATYFSSLPNMLWLMGIVFCIVLVAALVNAILNLFKWESGHFVMGILWILIALVLIFCLGLLFRDIRKMTCGSSGSQSATNFSCRMAADLIPAAQYKAFCPAGKYLPAGQTCRKADLTINWEGDSQPVFLNPGCCGAAPAIITWPFFLFGCLGLATLLFAILAAVGNLAQVEYDETLNSYFHSDYVVDGITVGLVGLLTVGMLAYFFFGVSPHFTNRYTYNTPAGFVSNSDGTLMPLPSYVPVPQPAADPFATPVPYGCYKLDRTNIPAIRVPNCANFAKCGVSLGLLATDSTFLLDRYTGSALIGPKSSRSFFFPGDLNQRNDFIHLYGTADEVLQSLKEVIVCHQNPIGSGNIYAHVIPADIGNLANDSLTAGVAYKPVELSADGANGVYGDFHAAQVCEGNCKVLLSNAGFRRVNIVGNLLVKDAEDRLVPYGVPESGLEIAFGRYHQGKFRALSFGSYDANGHFVIHAPANSATEYVGTIQLVDHDKMYLSNEIDVLVSQPPNGEANLFVGDIILTNAAGRGCK